MEGPSLVLAKEQLRPFVKKRVLRVTGNSKIDQDRFQGALVKDIFTWGKHLLFQFDGFALKVHFLLFGTYEAEVEGVAVTGDYKRARVPRLAFVFPNGELRMYNCSVKIMESDRLKRDYDLSADVLSRTWDPAKALLKMRRSPEEEIADVLLDQDIFAGVGNIIKNEVLSLAKVHPQTKVGDLPPAKLKQIVALARSFSKQFLRWRRAFVLRRHLRIHQRGACPYCGGQVVHVKTGKRARIAHYCPVCQRKF
jgi:endonuclease-8